MFRIRHKCTCVIISVKNKPVELHKTEIMSGEPCNSPSCFLNLAYDFT